jgi:hypothetical protein
MKTKVISRLEIPFPIGVHLVTITSIKFARKDSGELILREFEGQEYPLIELRFRDKEDTSKSFIERFSTNPRSQWIWDNLSKALHIDNKTKSISATEVKGVPFFIIIAGKVFLEGKNDLKRNKDGTIYYQKCLRLKFFEYSPIMSPQLSGDPTKEGVPSGIFLINEDIDINQFVKPVDDEF